MKNWPIQEIELTADETFMIATLVVGYAERLDDETGFKFSLLDVDLEQAVLFLESCLNQRT